MRSPLFWNKTSLPLHHWIFVFYFFTFPKKKSFWGWWQHAIAIGLLTIKRRCRCVSFLWNIYLHILLQFLHVDLPCICFLLLLKSASMPNQECFILLKWGREREMGWDGMGGGGGEDIRDYWTCNFMLAFHCWPVVDIQTPQVHFQDKIHYPVRLMNKSTFLQNNYYSQYLLCQPT